MVNFTFLVSVVYFIATIGAMFTTLYSVKVLYLTFLTNPNGPLINYKQAHEGDIFMSLPLIILAIFSIFFGYITKDIFIGLGSGFFSDNSFIYTPFSWNYVRYWVCRTNFIQVITFNIYYSLSILSILYLKFYLNYWLISNLLD